MSGIAGRIAVIAFVVMALVAVGLVGAYFGQRQTERRAQALLEHEGTPQPLADCPWGEASCVLAVSIEHALTRGDVDAVVAFAEPRFYICPGSAPRVTPGPSPLCDGVGPDQGREGYTIGRRFSEASVGDRDAFEQYVDSFVTSVDPTARDSVGDGGLKLYAFGCPDRAVPFQNVSCARLAIVLSAIVRRGDARQRELLIFWAVGNYHGRTLPITEVWDGAVLEGELPVLFATGGNLPDLGEVHVIDQSLR